MSLCLWNNCALANNSQLQPYSIIAAFWLQFVPSNCAHLSLPSSPSYYTPTYLASNIRNLFVFLFLLVISLFRFLFFILPQNTLAWLWQAAVKCSISVCGKCVCACVMCVCACVCVWGGALHMSKSKTISGAKQKLLNVWWSRFAVCANKIYTDNRSIKNAHTRTHTHRDIRVNIQLWPAV